ncbi:branched-chain amino acid ABC transporter substrate-binding protein [Cupriavidus nantongensis]|uniref:Branched-chain amino acid ABC transporter substrate-binding protein n=1 Tax=Cupriavidus nantongensis TaxID=1796606 RepID=A0A142JWE3_9BURK|nr:branched-chain amino acid ABC transporter substrate-binding protein [Cupriavidus nantongensis]
MALTALAAATGLAVAAAALAQVPAAPGEPYLDAPVADAAQQQADPSSRIATLTAVDGNLSFAPAGSDAWAAAGLNRPVTTGDRLWLEPGGRAELHAGTVALRLGGATAASILNLDDSTTQVKLTQGTLQVRVRALPAGQTVEIDTPNLAFVPREPGDYRLDVAPDGSTTTVTMRHGSAVVYGDSRTIELQRGDRMRFAGTDLADAGGGPVADDAFDRWTAARDAREDASQSARYVPREMPGYAALDGYGDWQEDPGYGAIWFPRVVSAGWVPYSAGHWAWIAPWGWTWIDDAPWGFAPSHYGRWAYVGSRWGWVPGPRVRPCYAPALVAFVGAAGPGWSVRVGSGPGVAWYPLGPRDAYRPVYRASPTYVARINRVTVNNFVMGDRRPPPYANRNVPGAITGMPARSFVEGRPARGLHRPEWRNLPTGEAHGAPPVAPVKGSLVGAAPLRPLPPQARHGFERQAIAARAPGRPATEELARRLAREGGVVPGAGPAWRGGNERRPGRDARPVPDVRMSQAAIAARDHAPVQPRPGRIDADGDGRADRNDAQARGEPWRGPGRGQSTRPDEARGFAGQPGVPGDAQRQQQAMQREQQRQQVEQQRALREQQRQLEEQRQQRMPPRQWADGQERPDPARQSQEMQRQRFEQQRQMQEAQQRQAEQQPRQMQEQQRAAQEQVRQQSMQRQADQQRQMQEQQRAVQEQQRQQAMQRQADQQRQMQDQQRAVQEQQRQQAMQRQAEQQRQMHEQQRAMQEQQRQQAMQRQAEQQQRQAEQQQRHMQEQQRAMQEQQRAMHEQQRQQAMQRQAEQQQRQMQERQRQQMDQQRQMHQQQRAQQERGQMEARQGRDGDRR